MLFFVIGLPGRFVEYCEAVTMGLVEKALGSAEFAGANSLEEIAHNLLGSGASQIVLGSRHPGGRVRRALIEAGRRFVVVLDDPRSSLAHLVARHGLGVIEATRLVASSCASIASFGATPGALVLRADREDAGSAAAAIARHLELGRCGGDIAEFAGAANEDDALLGPAEPAAWWGGVDPAEQAIVSGALGPYLDPPEQARLGQITWAHELFFVDERPVGQAKGGIDITGRTRCLLNGPHIMVPPGIWSLSAAFHFSPEAGEHQFQLEVVAGNSLIRTVLSPEGAGVVEANLTLALEELPERPIELRLSNERPAFGGQVTLHHVTLTPQLRASC